MKVVQWTAAVMLVLACIATEAHGGSKLLGKMGCAVCKVKATQYLLKMRLGLPISLVTSEAKLLCVVFGGYSMKVCAGVIVQWQDRVAYIVSHTSLSASEVCGSLVESCEFTTARRWTVPVPKPLPPSYHRPHQPAAGYGKKLKVLQLADIHLQLDYAYGSNAKCKNKLFCCRAKDGFPRKPRKKAGMWGSYENCDTPPALLSSLLHHIKATHPDVAYIMWSGDNSAHNVHELTRHQAIASNQAVTDLIRHTFPHALVLPTVGNHDSHPVNSFPPPTVRGRFSNDWLFNTLYNMWRPLLDGRLGHGVPHYNSFDDTFNPFGYYYVRAADAGFRILVLNTNYCYNFNFWTLLEPRDPGGQLYWLVAQLAEAEATGEMVHILGHISPGDPSCRPDWSHQYSRIIHRFRETISAQFFSHTHLDEFQVALDPGGRPFSTVYIAPSVSPWANLNPGYKIYFVEDNSWTVTDTEHWMTDLEVANRSPHQNPQWRLLSSARPAYGLSGLTPADWLSLANRMAHSERLFDAVYSTYWGASREREPCNASCRKKILCNIVTFDRSSDRHCEVIQSRLKG